MRIVAGRFGGRSLPGVIAKGTRPTSDRVREAIGSVLAARAALEDASVLDLFAGSGALGLEALSRGARSLVAVERDRRALGGLEDNVRALGVSGEVSVLALDLLGDAGAACQRLSQLAQSPFSLVFMDPPYANAERMPELLGALASAAALSPRAFALLEHAQDHRVSIPAGFEELSRYRYGDTAVTLLARIS